MPGERPTFSRILAELNLTAGNLLFPVAFFQIILGTTKWHSVDLSVTDRVAHNVLAILANFRCRRRLSSNAARR